MQQAREYGESRGICGAHWQGVGDIGKRVGAEKYKTLKEYPEFVYAILYAEFELRVTKGVKNN